MNRGRYSTRIPFGLSEASPLHVDTEAESFSLELRDVNGAPLLTLTLDTENGDYLLEAFGVRLVHPDQSAHTRQRNRERVPR